MGLPWLPLYCILLGPLASVRSGVLNRHDATLFRNFPRLFDNLRPSHFQRSFDPFDPLSVSPEFPWLADLPPMLNVPRVQVSCDQSGLTVLVDKKTNGATLTSDQVQLGEGCFSNGERPNQFVFTYQVDDCGTTGEVQNGLRRFNNVLHLNLGKPSGTWWETPSTVHISCLLKWPFVRPTFSESVAPAEKKGNFNLRAMTSSWTNPLESNIYKRGQVINLQVSTRVKPDQELFIHSCTVSASPEPQSKPRHPVIVNKGCTTPMGSPYPLSWFVASGRWDLVNFAVNTSYLISELYVHCSVILSHRRLTHSSKSCNYDLIQSRWEELSGDVKVCECCSSKCKGPSGRNFPEDTRATVTTGPFVVVDKDTVSAKPEARVAEEHSSLAPITDSMRRNEFDVTPQQGIVMVRQDPDAGLTVWLPGQVPESHLMSKDGPEEQSLNEIGGGASMWDHLPSMVEGWVIPEEFPRQKRSGLIETDAPQAEILLPAELTLNDLNWIDVKDEQEGANDAQPVIRSRLEFSKGADGTQMLSYEETLTQLDDIDESGGCKRGRNKRKQGLKQKKLRCTFLDLLRGMDKAE